MVSSISDNDSNDIQQLMLAMYQKLNSADTDGVKGLSKDELASIDTGDDFGGAAFLNSLKAQFDKLDANGDGQVSESEISAVKPPEVQLGPPPGMSIESSDGSTDSGNAVGKAIDDFVDSFLESFKDGLDSKDAQKTDSVGSLADSMDKDASGGISLAELSTVSTVSGQEADGFLNDLKENFGKYDTDNSGELSKDEIAASKVGGLPPEIAAEQSTASSWGSSLGHLSSSFLSKLLNNYTTGNDLASSLSVAG